VTICDIPCAVNTPLHQTYFPANTKAGFQVLEFTFSAGIFLKIKTLWKLRLQIEATVNFLPFHGSPARSSSAAKIATHPAYPEVVRNLPKP